MGSSITIRVPEKLRLQLASICEEEDRPLSDVVRESISHYVAIRRFRRLRGQILPFAEAQGILTDEDVFREMS